MIAAPWFSLPLGELQTLRLVLLTRFNSPLFPFSFFEKSVKDLGAQGSLDDFSLAQHVKTESFDQ